MSDLETLKEGNPTCEKCGAKMFAAESHWDPTKQEYKYIRWACPRFFEAHWVSGCDYAVMESTIQQHEAELAKAQETIAEQKRRLEQQDERLDHFESIGVDAYDHACELMEKAQRERMDRGVAVGTTGSLCDGIAWVYRRLASVESDLAAAQATIQQQARELEEEIKHHANFKANYEHQSRQFQQETLRTGELSQMLVKFMKRSADKGCTAEPWAKDDCPDCTLMREAKELLDRPINVTKEKAAHHSARAQQAEAKKEPV